MRSSSIHISSALVKLRQLSLGVPFSVVVPVRPAVRGSDGMSEATPAALLWWVSMQSSNEAARYRWENPLPVNWNNEQGAGTSRDRQRICEQPLPVLTSRSI